MQRDRDQGAGLKYSKGKSIYPEGWKAKPTTAQTGGMNKLRLAEGGPDHIGWLAMLETLLPGKSSLCLQQV